MNKAPFHLARSPRARTSYLTVQDPGSELPPPPLMTQTPTDYSEVREPQALEEEEEEPDLNQTQDVRERPVREQLKNTSITPSDRLDAGVQDPVATEDATSEAGSVNTNPDQPHGEANIPAPSLRGRRKRSFDELNPESPDDSTDIANSKHFRKRSRDNRAIPTESDNEDDVSNDDNDDEDDAEEKDISPLTRAEEISNDVSDSVQPQDRHDSKASNNADRATTPPANASLSASPKLDDATSPQNKRNRDQFMFDNDQNTSATKPAKQPLPTSTDLSASNDTSSAKTTSTLPATKSVDEEPETKRQRDESLPSSTKAVEQITSPKLSFENSGFANTSAQSPFGAMASTKSPPPPSSRAQTSSNAFASSGFASFADSNLSPFGAVGPPLKTADSDAKESVEPAPKDSVPASGFAALSGNTPSPFAAAGSSTFGSQSGFGQLSNGFGSFGGGDKGFGAPLSSFAAPGGSGIMGLSSKSAKPIGAAQDPSDEEHNRKDDEEGENEAVISPRDDTPIDPRFYQQEVETGEEDEETLFTSRAKLYVSQDKQWKERGVGTFKVNASTTKHAKSNGESSSKRTARFIMRADGSHRVVLNSPIKKEISLTDSEGGAPKGKNAIFLGFIDEKATMMQLKMRSNSLIEELYDVVAGLQKEL